MAKSKTDITIELMRTMSELRNHTRQYIQNKIKEHNINLTFEMLEVLSQLWKRDKINQQELSDLTFRDKSSMTYLIDNLVKRNLVTRTEDGNDRRSKLIALTEEGKALHDRMYPWGIEMYTLASADLTAGELETSRAMLITMTENIKKQMQ